MTTTSPASATIRARPPRPLATLSPRQARRLALVRGGLLRPDLTGLPARAAGRGRRARQRCHAVIDRFGFLQLDSVAVCGARTHGIVLASRLASLSTDLVETLLAPGEPLFEYWGHEASWLPLSLYPVFGFRRHEYRVHPWWGDMLKTHHKLAREIMARVAAEGPLRSIDLDGERLDTTWGGKLATRVAEALWSAGELAVSERQAFQRRFDLTERVIPAALRATDIAEEAALDTLLLRALDGHGWAETGTLAATWRLRNRRAGIDAALQRLSEAGHICAVALAGKTRKVAGWVRSRDLDDLERIEALRPRRDRGVLLSPFDPLLWDRARVQKLFGFEQLCEIYKPPAERRYGYYCLPILAGDRLIARVDLRAERRTGRLQLLSRHFEHTDRAGKPLPRDQAALDSALRRFATSVALDPPGGSTRLGS